MTSPSDSSVPGAADRHAATGESTAPDAQAQADASVALPDSAMDDAGSTPATDAPPAGGRADDGSVESEAVAASADLEPTGLPNPLDVAALPASVAPPVRKRPRPGERRVQILQTLATMLEVPGSERVTTAALAARLDVSEAALYRHFASKAQMFEGLIEFIEQSVFTLVNQIAEREGDPDAQVRRMLGVLLQFGEKNPGMTRVMTGDALVFENERLMTRMNQFFDRIESQLRQPLRAAAEARGSQSPTADANAMASALVSFAIGRLHRWSRSGFRKSPTDQLDVALRVFAA